ncbi:MAG: glutathione S-transferase family protein [Maricaulaceae bacterium]|nr:glutathione S-transferase family protein [Maricaulaceae bacterium]
MGGYVLYGGRGCGSAAVEAALELAHAPYEYVNASPFGDAAAKARLAAVNPALQVPALMLPGGAVMTESVAILLHVAETFPHARLAPRTGSPDRPVFLRWLIFLAANVYSTYAISDRPGRFLTDETAHEALKDGANERRKHLWSLMEAQIKPAPFLAGAEMTLLDVYAAMMSRWSPGRDWFEGECPKLLSAVQRAEKHPKIAAIWKRNFD